MATIKKVIVPNNELPFIQSDLDGLYYSVRYRVISEDRNRTSHWSPIYRIEVPATSEVGLPYTTEDRIHGNVIGATTKTLIITWTPPQPSEYVNPLESLYEDVSVFDIFIRWKDNSSNILVDWEYYTTIRSNTYSVLVSDSSYKLVDVAIQLPTVNKERDDRVTLYLLEGESV